MEKRVSKIITKKEDIDFFLSLLISIHTIVYIFLLPYLF